MDITLRNIQLVFFFIKGPPEYSIRIPVNQYFNPQVALNNTFTCRHVTVITNTGARRKLTKYQARRLFRGATVRLRR